MDTGCIVSASVAQIKSDMHEHELAPMSCWGRACLLAHPMAAPPITTSCFRAEQRADSAPLPPSGHSQQRLPLTSTHGSVSSSTTPVLRRLPVADNGEIVVDQRDYHVGLIAMNVMTWSLGYGGSADGATVAESVASSEGRWSSVAEDSEFFVDLLDATIRSSRNYHRLDHCSHVHGSGPKSVFRFKEETITDLLVGELAGKEYEVSADCPVCGPGPCSDWDGHPARAVSGIRIRALTKHEEGGDRRTGKAGAHADFILAVRRQDPGSDMHLTGARELRILVQAKRGDPSRPIFRPAAVQYNKLIESAQRYGAVPYYALYVQQPGPHHSMPTACPRARSASDRSVVLAAARPSTESDALPGRPLAAILSDARPLRCLADCTCFDLGTSIPEQSGPNSVWDAVRRFIARDFPDYQPVSPEDQLPPDVPTVRANLSEYKPHRGNAKPRRRSPHPGANSRNLGKDEVLLIRLGTLRPSPTPDRRFIGYASDMPADDLRDAGRMYWHLDGKRARRVRYLVISANRQVLDAWEVAADGLTFVEGADGLRRVAFAVTDIADSELKHRLLIMARHRLDQLGQGARNPCIYLRDDVAD